MPFPSGIYPIGGPILDISGGPLTPSAALRAAGVVSVRGGKITRVNAAGDGWEEVPGHVISATAPTDLFEGLLWYDTTLKALKHYNGTAFVNVTGTAGSLDDLSVTTGKLADGAVTAAKLALAAATTSRIAEGAVTTPKLIDLAVTTAKLAVAAVTKEKLAAAAVTKEKLADDSTTPAKLDADNGTKQDAFLARLNALRRDLNNMATLTPSTKRAALIKLGAIVEGGRPKPSADYSARLWIDDTNDQAYICRNFIEYTAAVMGGFADATIPSTVTIVEFDGDLAAPTSILQRAYTYGDNHFWEGRSGPLAAFHWGQTDDHTVLALLVTGASSVGEWLGQASWDGGATARLPTAGLAANREYFFWHTGTKTIRRLNPGSYVAANSAIDHWKWVPVSANAANVFDWAETGNLELIPVDKLPTEATSTLFLDDLYSMPGGPSEAVEIEGGRDGRFYKTVYGLDHNVRFNSITLQGKAPATYATYRIRLLKGNRTETDESVIQGGALLWPLTPTEDVEAQNVESTDLFERKFTFPAISLNRGEYLVVEWGRAYADDARCFVRVVRDLREHQAFTAFRFIGSGTDELDLSGNPTIDNVEWTNAGLWIKIDYEIEYDVGAAVAAHGNDDYAKTGLFALSQKELSLRLTRELGGHVDVPAIDLSPLAGLTNSEVTTIANARALARYTAAEKTKLSESPANASITAPKLAAGAVTPAKLLTATLANKKSLRDAIAAAPLDAPAFTGLPTAPTPTSTGQATQIATKLYVDINAGGGGALGDAISILARPTDATQQGALAGTGASEVTLLEDLVKGRLLEFHVTDSSTDGHIESIGYLMSDAILALSAIGSSSTPSATGSDEDSIQLKLHQPGNTAYAHTSLRIWRSGHTSGRRIWAHSGRDASIRLSILSYTLGGGAAGGATGAGGTSGASNTLRLQLILHQWGASKPADPTQVWVAAGWSGVIDGNAASSWVEDEPTVVPAGTHWIALANAYSVDAGATWTQYPWSVFSVGAGYLAEQYSEDAESWHATRTDNDSWMRLRRPDGTWTGSIALGAVPWQPILDWADVYRPNYDSDATVAWKFNINEVDLLSYNDLVLEARFFYYINGAPDHFSAVARGSIPLGTVNKGGVLGTWTPTTELRWQTVPEDFLLTDWTSAVAARVARRRGTYRAVLDRDAGLGVVLGEDARETSEDVSYRRATICFGLQSADTGTYTSTIDAVAIYVPLGTQAYSRTQIRIVGR